MTRLAFLVAWFLVVGQLVGNAGKEHSRQDQQPIAAKLPVPDDAASAKALGTVRQVFDQDYRSRKVQDRRALVGKLLKQADDPANEAAMQYMLLTEAAQIAAEAGDAQTALDAVAKKASRFEDDPLQLKLDVLSVASRATASPEDQTSLVEKWISLANEAA